MAHFAQLSPNNEVIRVLVVADDQEHRGAEFLSHDLHLGGTWLQCSYNGRIRRKFPGPGDIYNADLDMFIEPQPHVSWTLDPAGDWQSPIPHPDDGWEYTWDEPTFSWIVTEVPE